MNRAARRAKPRQVQRWDRTAAYEAANKLLVSCSNDTQHEDARARLITPAYLSVEHIKTGSCEAQDFEQLLEVTMYGYILAGQLHEFAANDDTRALLLRCEEPLRSAVQTLQTIAERKQEEGTFRFGGSEIKQIQEALDLTDQLTGVAAQGHTLRALLTTMEVLQHR